MVARNATRSWRTSTKPPSAVCAATTTAALRWQTVHGNGFGRVGEVTLTLCTSRYGLAKAIWSSIVSQPGRSGVNSWKGMPEGWTEEDGVTRRSVSGEQERSPRVTDYFWKRLHRA